MKQIQKVNMLNIFTNRATIIAITSYIHMLTNSLKQRCKEFHQYLPNFLKCLKMEKNYNENKILENFKEYFEMGKRKYFSLLTKSSALQSNGI